MQIFTALYNAFDGKVPLKASLSQGIMSRANKERLDLAQGLLSKNTYAGGVANKSKRPVDVIVYLRLKHDSHNILHFCRAYILLHNSADQT